MLIAEGYFISHGAAGTTVAPGLSRLMEESSPPSSFSPGSAIMEQPPIRNEMQPFQIGLPALDLFPRKTWVRLASRHLRNLEMTTRILGTPGLGDVPLRAILRDLSGDPLSAGAGVHHSGVSWRTGPDCPNPISTGRPRLVRRSWLLPCPPVSGTVWSWCCILSPSTSREWTYSKGSVRLARLGSQ